MSANSFFNHKAPNPDTDNAWVPDYMDVLGGPSRVKIKLEEMAQTQAKLSTELMGILAGRDLLDQYFNARQNLGEPGALKAAFSMAGARYFSTAALPLAGMAAAIGVDMAIFGSAAKEMHGQGHVFNAFALGSLIFASLMGLHEAQERSKDKSQEKNKNTGRLYAALMVSASLGASFLAADNDAFRAKFTDTIASTFDRGNADERERLAVLKSDLKALQNANKEKNDRRDTGGNGGKTIRGDGVNGNDSTADLLDAEILELDKQIRSTAKDVAFAEIKLKTATEKDPVDFAGRILATLYMGAWLAAAQFLIKEVMASAPAGFRRRKDELTASSSRQKKFKLLVNDLQDPDPAIREGRVRTLISNTLSQFAEILYTSPGHSSPEYVENLFSAENLEKMTDIGTKHVLTMVEPKEPGFDIKSAFKGKPSARKADNATDEAPPASPAGPAMG